MPILPRIETTGARVGGTYDPACSFAQLSRFRYYAIKGHPLLPLRLAVCALASIEWTKEAEVFFD